MSHHPFATSLLFALAFSLAASSCSRHKDDPYGYYYEDDTEDIEASEAVVLSRDKEDDCLFTALVDDRGTAILQSAIVSGNGSVIPSGVQLSKDGGVASTAGLIGSAFGEPGWTARFTIDPLDGSPNGLVGTNADFDGTWSIVLTVDPPKTCADVEVPLTLELLAKE